MSFRVQTKLSFLVLMRIDALLVGALYGVFLLSHRRVHARGGVLKLWAGKDYQVSGLFTVYYTSDVKKGQRS